MGFNSAFKGLKCPHGLWGLAIPLFTGYNSLFHQG